jgi:hypothetical protein
MPLGIDNTTKHVISSTAYSAEKAASNLVKWMQATPDARAALQSEGDVGTSILLDAARAFAAHPPRSHIPYRISPH